MKLSVDERTLVADVKSYIDYLEDFRAEVGEHAERIKRMDLTIYHGKKLICIAEFKRQQHWKVQLLGTLMTG